MALAGFAPIFTVVVAIAIMWMSYRVLDSAIDIGDHARALARNVQAPDDPTPLSEDGRRAREIMIANALRGPFGQTIVEQSKGAEKDALVESRRLYPEPSVAEIDWAKAALAAESSQHESPFDDSIRHPAALAAKLTRIMGVAWCGCAVILAFAFRGGVSLRVFGVRVRDRRGRRASRLRCALRALVAGVPIAAAYSAPSFLMHAHMPTAAYAAWAVAVLVHAAWVAHAISRPSKSLQDVVAGTQLVPL